MHKLILTLIGLIIFFIISGQEVQKLNYQINFGTSISLPYKKTIEILPEIEDIFITHFKSDYDYFIELMIAYNFNNQMSLNTGASFINNKLQVNSIAGRIEHDGIIRTSYLGIPVVFDYQIFKNMPLRLGLGVYLNFLLTAKEKGTSYFDTTGFSSYYLDPLLESSEVIEEYDVNVTDHYNPLDFGLTAKIEYEFKLVKKINMLIFSKFNYGLTKVRKRPNWYDKWKNYNLLFGLGFKI